MKHDDQEFLSGLMDGEWQTLDIRASIRSVCEDEALRAKWSRYHLARQAMRQESVAPGGTLAARVAAMIADEPAYSNVTAIGGASEVGTDAAAADAGTAGRSDAAASVTTARRDDADAAVVRAGGEARRRATGPRTAAVRTFAAGFGLAASVAVVTAVGLNVLDGGMASPAVTPGAGVQVASSVAADRAQAVAALDPFSRQVPGAPLPTVELVANQGPTGAYWTGDGSSARRVDSEARLNMFLSQHIENSPTSEQQGMLPYSRLVGYTERDPSRGRLAERTPVDRRADESTSGR